MITNFFKTSIRNLWKTKGYSFLNIFGLAVGIAAAAIIFLWVEGQLTKNDHFPNKKDIYIVKSKQTYDGTTYVFDSSQGLLGPAIKQEIPGIKHTVRTDWGTSLLFAVGDKTLYQDGFYADPEIIDLFSMEFVEGDRKTALDKPNNILLSVTGAEVLFGNQPAVGKTVRINDNEVYTVTGVTKDLPSNSNYQFKWIIPFKKYEIGKEWLTHWGSNSLMTLVQLEPNADLEQINKQLYDFVKRKTNGEVFFSANFLYPMSRWNTYNVFDKDGNEQEGNIKNIRLFTIIASIVLLIACINFMNLATARSEKRAKEVGMRKVIGASRKSLIVQFLGESLLSAFLSTLLAIALIFLCIKPFNALIGEDLSVNLFQPLHLGFLCAITLICGLLAGSYPALYLSAFNPLVTIKGGKQKAGYAGLVRRGLVILQYTASIVLIICTIIIYQQIQHAKNRDLGFDRSQVITTAQQGQMGKHIDLIKEQLLATGNIEHVGLSTSNIMSVGSNTSDFKWEGKDPNSNILISLLWVDEDLIPSLSMEIHDGRNFRPNFRGDSTSLIINQAFAELIQPDGMVAGKVLDWSGKSYTIVGVVKNFVYNDMYATPSPLVFTAIDNNSGLLNIKTKAHVDLPQTIKQIEKIIKSNNPSYPFEYRFLDDMFNNRFKSELFIQKLASIFAVISIIISCLGLFGLAAYSAEQRAREVSIRKVLGASVRTLIAMLNREFMLLVGISCLIAFPIAWWFMRDWLRDFNYRIDIEWSVFALAGGLALVIALFTITSQAWRAATSNPTKKLRNE